MTRYLILGILAIAAIFPFQSRAMCIAKDEAGFLHASAQRFPANIKGVLFEAPTSWALDEQDFEITSPNALGPLRPHISPVNLPPDSAASRELPPDTRLVRVNIPGNFRPGTPYTVRYTGRHTFSSHYPLSMTFAVDTGTVDLDAADFKVALDPDAVRRTHAVWEGDDGEIFAAATRGVTLQRSPALDLYRQAISFFHEQADVSGEGATGGFSALYPPAKACIGREFGAGYANQPDVVYRACGTVLKPTAVRSSAAFLEVDDRVVLTDTKIAAWGPEMAAACAPPGLVLMALEEGEPRSALGTMCNAGNDPEPASPPYELQHRYMPTAGQFAELARLSPGARACTVRFMGGLLRQGRGAPAELLEVFVRLMDETLAAEDKQIKQQLLRKLSMWSRTENAEGQQSALTGAALHPLVPRLQLLAKEPEFATDATAVLGWVTRQQ